MVIAQIIQYLNIQRHVHSVQQIGRELFPFVITEVVSFHDDCEVTIIECKYSCL